MPPSRLPSGEELACRLIELVLDGPVVFSSASMGSILSTVHMSGGDSALRLELVFEVLARELDPDVLVHVYRLLEGASPNANHFAVLAAGAREIVTLNQDVLLEEAAQLLGRAPPILHLHGRCDRPDTIVTLLREYLSGLDGLVGKRFDRAVANRDVVVIGYSGRDRDVMSALVRARPRSVLWIAYVPPGKSFVPAPELQLLAAGLGARLRIEESSDPSGWLRQHLSVSARRRVERAQQKVSSGKPELPQASRDLFASLGERERNLGIGRLLAHIGVHDAWREGLERLRRRKAGRHPDVELALADATVSSGDRHGGARRYAALAERHADNAELVCAAMLGRAEALSNEAEYGSARKALTSLRRASRRLDSSARRHYLGWAAEREARMKGMTNDEGGALRDYARARRLFDSIHSIDGMIAARIFGADMLRSRGRYREALDMLDEAYTDSALYSRAYWKAWPRWYRGATLASMGQLGDGLAELEQGELLARSGGNNQGIAWMAVARACFERARDLDAAKHALSESKAAIERYGRGMVLCEARVIFEEAELARARGDGAGSRRHISRLRHWTKHRLPVDAPYLWAHAAAVEAELAREASAPETERLLCDVIAAYRRGRWQACVARMATSLWLYRGGQPPAWLVRLCEREGYEWELQRLRGDVASGYYPLHTL